MTADLHPPLRRRCCPARTLIVSTRRAARATRDRRGQVVTRDAPWGAVLCARAPRAREQLFFFFF